MSAAFTDPWSVDFYTTSFLGELRTAFVERSKAVGGYGEMGGGYFPSADAGTDVQALTYYKELQEWLEAYCEWFVDHTALDTEMAARPALFTVSSWRAAAGLNSSGFRAYCNHPAEGGSVAYRVMQAGDIIGPWIFEDLQKGLKALKYTLLEISWERGELDNFQQGSGEGSDIAAAIADAVANAAWSLAADYPPLAWTSLYNTASSPVYSGFNRWRQYATVHMPGGCDLGGDFDLYLMGALQGDQYGASGQAILEGLLSLFGTVASPGSQIMVGDFDLSAFDWPTEDVYVGYEVDASSFYLAKWSFTNA